MGAPGDGTGRTDSARGNTARYGSVPPRSMSLRELVHTWWHELVALVRDPGPMPLAGVRRRFLYGFAQPFVGVRVMLRDRTILGEALAPAVLLALVCIAIALSTDELRA